MTQAHNTKAAELHEATAKSHRAAVEHLNKAKPDSGKEHAAKALSQSEAAHEASIKAQGQDLASASKKM